MKQHFHRKRLFVDFSLQSGHQAQANEFQHHYLAHVLRMKEGDKILLFNGKEGEWLSNISYKRDKHITFSVIQQKRTQTLPSDLHYIFAPIKTKRLDYMIQKSVEMGVSILFPVITRYTNNTIHNIDRVRTYTISSAEQCNILTIPSIYSPVTLDSLLEDWDHSRRIVFADESCSYKRPFEALQEIPHGSPLALLVGPEGGFHPEEQKKLRSLPFVIPLSLGPRILRSDTAAVAGLALIQSICGDWYAPHQ
ncbi:MAG: 16S rRNA (uracil(1498)-N(3))-methyltransferase [Candidatus Liberibacter ctenarytainae]|uniref:Ribosomal RNA small subunit methyltransferase E n=1 Tax=Candidatus Liberibacter ctenarytainae TaxID=2020335 RepID=A0A937AJR9_9HYPH|nr:16S rRNA (uracil(1498)-N(3))-methyltransferase [Candidatus Liberibacter ctenarytainae]